ncbi:hypothetical protein, partial [Pseudovibrio sp. POLY-S9]|uniref:hypothetical protein n=1 Tax=Pseudovibrio sp. POLY-S9 TaxID=1576596 RepID=UPI000A73970A
MDSLNTSNPDYYEDGIRFGTRPELIAQIKKLQEELATAKSTESDRLLEEMEGSLESVDMGIAFMPPTTSHEYAKGCNDNLEEVRRVLSEVFDTSETREPCLLNRLDKIANRFLWGVHFIGPDEIWAAESYAAAVRLAKQHNQHFISSMETTDVAVIAAPTPWIGEP